MRLLIVSQYYWPESFRINDIAVALGASEIEVVVLTGKPNYPTGNIFPGYRASGSQREVHSGIPIYRVPLSPRGRGGWRLVLNYFSFVFCGALIGPWLLRKKDFDIVLVFAPSPILQAIPAIVLGLIKSCPVVLWVQDLWPDSLSATGNVKHPLLLKGVELVVKWIYRRVDLLLVQSPKFIPKVRKLSGSTPVAYYPNSFIEDSEASRGEAMVCPGFDCRFPVLFAGNFGRAQAVEVVLEAATILSHVGGIRFVMLGDGERREWMMQQCADRKLDNLVCPGRYPVEMMPNFMEQAGALLVTLADTEVFSLTIPSKIQAYLAAGRPIIACLNGAGAEIVEDAGAGVTVPSEDARGLAQAVLKLYEMGEAEREAMGACGRQYYESHFSHQKLMVELKRHLEDTVRAYRGSSL